MASRQNTATRASTRIKSQIPAPQTARTTRVKTATNVPAPSTAKRVARKPLANRENDVNSDVPASNTSLIQETQKKKVVGKPVLLLADDREPIMAYLRIRPHLGDNEPTTLPYLTSLSDTSVCMTDPNHENQLNGNRFRPSTLPQSSKYTFSHVFLPGTTQSDFFTKTTLPLVNDVLQGQNALLFAYGTTNSGKTYTVQGGTKEGSAGIVPRTLDVLFNSIEGLHGDGRYRPVRLQDVELSDSVDVPSPQVSLSEPTLREVFAEHLGPSTTETEIDPTSLKVDRNYGYCVWLSYAEIYNEKVYDLLENVKDDSTNLNPGSNVRFAPLNSGHPLRVTRKALQLKSCPRSDSDPFTGYTGKYIEGIRQFRVQSASQAKALLKLGQLHRRVFGTLANRESSRSHALVIIKIVRGHRGEQDNIASFQVSRLTLVDLAGSERNKQAQATGDRLKEAGNINKSLMVLGQCLAALRVNQRRIMANAIVEVGKTNTRESKKVLALVPFRHSKLTEVLMDYFVGDGRVVMIVNVNPFDTGYDENSHVMKFAALAREVYVTPAPAPTRRLPAAVLQSPSKTRSRGTTQATGMNTGPYRRKVTISMGGIERKMGQAVVEILEEDENDRSDSDSDNEPINPLVDALFDEIEELRLKLFESEMRCAIVEAETREEVIKEMEERMTSMERMFVRRLMTEVEQNEMKTDAKIDLLHQSGMFGNSPMKKSSSMKNIFSLEDMAQGMKQNEDSDLEEELVFESDEESLSESSSRRSLSPLTGKHAGKGKKPQTTRVSTQEIRQIVPDGPEAILLPSDEEDMTEETETDDDGDEAESVGISSTTDNDEESEDDEWVPAPERTPRPVRSKGRQSFETTSSLSPQSVDAPGTVKRQARGRVLKLAQEMNDLSLTSEDSIDLLSPKKVNGNSKKKRQLSKKAVMTEEMVERTVKNGDERSARSRKASQR